MLDYVDSKERQGIFFEKPSEKIHLPEAAELALTDHTKYKQIIKIIKGFIKNVTIISTLNKDRTQSLTTIGKVHSGQVLMQPCQELRSLTRP